MAISKQESLEEKIKLPTTESLSRFYEPKKNRKAIRILTVAVYVLCVSLAAIMLSLYYIFIWDPNIKPYIPKVTNCDKIIIPENIAIGFVNSTEITAAEFYRNIQNYYQTLQQIKQRTEILNNQTKEINKFQQQKTSSHSNHYNRKRPKNSPSITTIPSTITTTTRLIPILKTYRRKNRLRMNDDDEDDDDIEIGNENSDGSGHFIITENLESNRGFS